MTEVLVIKLASHWEDGMDPQQAWDTARLGLSLKADRVLNCDTAFVINPDHVIVAAATITGVSKVALGSSRRNVEGVLISDHPVLGNSLSRGNSRNPVRYMPAA